MNSVLQLATVSHSYCYNNNLSQCCIVSATYFSFPLDDTHYIHTYTHIYIYIFATIVSKLCVRATTIPHSVFELHTPSNEILQIQMNACIHIYIHLPTTVYECVWVCVYVYIVLCVCMCVYQTAIPYIQYICSFLLSFMVDSWQFSRRTPCYAVVGGRWNISINECLKLWSMRHFTQQLQLLLLLLQQT